MEGGMASKVWVGRRMGKERGMNGGKKRYKMNKKGMNRKKT